MADGPVLIDVEIPSDEGGSARPIAARAARHQRRQLRRGPTILVGGLSILVVLYGMDLLAYRSKVHAGVQVGDVAVGGMSLEEATSALTTAARDIRQRQVSFAYEGGQLTATVGELGWNPDPQATALAALDVGNSGTPWTDAWDRTLAWVGGSDVAWQGTWDGAQTRRAMRNWANDAEAEPREGVVRVVEGEVVARHPVPGQTIDVDAVIDQAQRVITGGDPGLPPLPIVAAEPLTTDEEVDALAAKAKEAISGPISATLGDVQLELEGTDLAPMIKSHIVGEGSDARLQLYLAPKLVEAYLEPYRADVEVPAQDATFEVVGHRVKVVHSHPGRALDPIAAGKSLLKIATSPAREGKIRLVLSHAELTTKDAKALGITTRISTFTTYHSCCEPRVTNIHLSADELDGAIIQPGEEFSLNMYVGERTLEEGYVVAPAIVNGGHGEMVGGGISQLTTTMFNAAFFAGFPFGEHKAHSFYISRYPMGREATLSWPHPDLVFANDLDFPVLIKTSYTETSVTVSVYGQPMLREVTATDPETISESKDGSFTVVVKRIITLGGETVREETFVTHYIPEPVEEPAGKGDNKDGNNGGTGGGGGGGGT